jgi:hypothetical protein
LRRALVIVLLAAAGCASSGGGSGRVAGQALPEVHTTTAAPPTTRNRPPIASLGTTTTVAAEQPGWLPVSYSRTGIALDAQSHAFADGSHVIVVRFRAGQTKFALHVGSQDPPTGGVAISPSARSAVSNAELPLLLAAFNGGFKVGSGSGGFEIDGQILTPLQSGRSSFVIDTNGSGHIGVWGQDVPTPKEHVASVRQNLFPLVIGSQLSPSIADVALWGARFKGEDMVARSALGEDKHGNILYAGSMVALPSDVGTALIDAGATNAMELDINPEWVQLALAAHPGGQLRAGVSGQNRPPNQYLVGWTRDFFTVLAGR